MNVTLSFKNKEITPWEDMVFWKQILDKIDFKEQVYNCLHLPTQNANSAHAIDVILESFITRIWHGANHFLYTEVTRTDQALGQVFDWKKTPARDAYKRYFGKFAQRSTYYLTLYTF